MESLVMNIIIIDEHLLVDAMSTLAYMDYATEYWREFILILDFDLQDIFSLSLITFIAGAVSYGIAQVPIDPKNKYKQGLEEFKKHLEFVGKCFMGVGGICLIISALGIARIDILKGLSKPAEMFQDKLGKWHIEHSHDMGFNDFIEKVSENKAATQYVSLGGGRSGGYDNPTQYIEQYHQTILESKPPMSWSEVLYWSLGFCGKLTIGIAGTVAIFYGGKVLVGLGICFANGIKFEDADKVASFHDGVEFYKKLGKALLFVYKFGVHLLSNEEQPSIPVTNDNK